MATDPRTVHGSIAGPGGPRDRNSVVLETDRAVLFDDMTVCEVETGRGRALGVPPTHMIAMVLAGRINKSPDRADVLFLFDLDGAAAIVTELLALAMRMDDAELTALINSRLNGLAADDAIGGERRG